MRETGEALNVSEEAARKRIERSLIRLRTSLTQAGFVLTVAAVGECLAAGTAHAAPSGLLERATLAASHTGQGAGAASATAIAHGTLRSMTAAKWAVSAAAILGGLAAVQSAPVLAGHLRLPPAKTVRAFADSAGLSGAIVGSDGKPVAGVVVDYYPLPMGDGPQATATTDNSGRFAFDSSKVAAKPGSSFEIVADDPSHGFGGRMEQPWDGKPVAFRIAAGCTVHLSFVDESGHALPGLRVSLPFVDGLFVPKADLTRFSGVTDAHGVFLAAGVPAGDAAVYAVDDDRFAAPRGSSSQITPPAGAVQYSPPAITLAAAATIEGVVTYGTTGKPAAGVEIWTNRSYGTSADVGPAMVKTGADGAFTLKRLEAGSYRVYAKGESGPQGYAWHSSEVGPIPIASGDRRQGVSLVLEPSAVVTGTVSDRLTGRPDADAEVVVLSTGEPMIGQSATTDAQGRYRAFASPGTISVEVDGDTQPPSMANGEPGATVKIDLATIAVSGQRLLEGIVVDSSGRPVPNATVFAASNEVQTGPDGRFAFTPNQTGTLFVAWAKDGQTATPVGVPVLLGRDVTLSLTARTGSLDGVVQDDAGHPLAGASVHLYLTTMDVGQETAVQQTDSGGRYRFDGLYPAGLYSIYASAPGYGSVSSESATASSGQMKTLSAVVLRAANSYVAGQVLDSHGVPLAGATIRTGNADAQTTTDSQGRFRLNGVPPGQVTLIVSDADEGTAILEPTGGPGVIIRTDPVAAARPASALTLAPPSTQPILGHDAPEFMVRGWVNTPPLAIHDLRGKIVVVDSVGDGTGSVLELQGLVHTLADQGVAAIDLNQDKQSTTDEVAQFVRREGITIPVAIDEDSGLVGHPGATAMGLGIRATESFAVVDRNGKIAYAGTSYQEMSDTLGRLLAR